MVYALLSENKYYYITVNDHLLPESRLWNKYNPQPDDQVIAKGYIREKKDMFGNPFHTVEIVSLKPKVARCLNKYK